MKNIEEQELEYIAVNAYGWFRASNPFAALLGVEIPVKPYEATDPWFEARAEEKNWSMDKWEEEHEKFMKIEEEWDNKIAEAQECVNLWVRVKQELISFDNFRPDGDATLLYGGDNYLTLPSDANDRPKKD